MSYIHVEVFLKRFESRVHWRMEVPSVILSYTYQTMKWTTLRRGEGYQGTVDVETPPRHTSPWNLTEKKPLNFGRRKPQKIFHAFKTMVCFCSGATCILLSGRQTHPIKMMVYLPTFLRVTSKTNMYNYVMTRARIGTKSCMFKEIWFMTGLCVQPMQQMLQVDTLWRTNT